MNRKIELFAGSSSVTYGGTGTITLTPGAFTKIIAWKVPDKVGWSFIKNLKVLMKLKNASSEELPKNAKIVISFKRPAGEKEEQMSSVKIYAPYADLSLASQNSVENDPATRMSLFRAGSLKEESELWIEVNTPTAFTLDWSKSEIYIRDVTEFDL